MSTNRTSSPKPTAPPSAPTPPPSQKATTDPPHIDWLVDTGKTVTTTSGNAVRIFELRHQTDPAVLSAWAKRFRHHYCRDDQLDSLRKGTGHSRAEYLTKIKFPSKAEGLGPATRAGDFGEVLVADYLEFRLKFWVPRWRYDAKTINDESEKGCDVVGFRFVKDGAISTNDTLALFEAKTDFSGTTPSSRLQDAVNDSAKDHLRKAFSLNALKQRFLDREQHADVARVERFQDPNDRPYKEIFGAVALVATKVFDPQETAKTTVTAHPDPKGLVLIVIHGHEMMKLVHDLYARAADEA